MWWQGYTYPREFQRLKNACVVQKEARSVHMCASLHSHEPDITVCDTSIPCQYVHLIRLSLAGHRKTAKHQT